MIILNMQQKNVGIAVTNIAFSLENNIAILDIKVLEGTADYDLTDKTITASFNQTGIETGFLNVVDGMIQLPITNNLIKIGYNLIQLNFRWNSTKLEQSPIMTWQIYNSITTTEIDQETVDIVTYLISENNKAIAAEANRVETEKGRAASENARKAKLKYETAKYFNKNWIDSNSSYAISGSPIVSNPDSLIYVSSLGNNGVASIIFDSIGSKGGYSVEAGGSMNGIITELNDYAYYPYYINRPYASESRYGSARWRLVENEYPSGILEYSYAEGDRTVHAKLFVKEEVAYTVFDLSGVNDMRFSTSLKSIDGEKDFTGGYEVLDGKGYIAIKDNTTGLWFGITCSDMKQYQVGTDNINATLGLDTSKTSVTSSACILALGCGAIGDARGQVVYCTSMGLDKNIVVNRILSGITNWRVRLMEAKDDWSDFFKGLGDNLQYLSVEQKAKYYTCIQQIRSLTYNGYMSAGTPNWTKNFIRDTAWTMYSLCHTGHQKAYELAKTMMDWYSGVDSFVHSNAYTVDKKRCESSINQTETASTFLLAVAKLCEVMNYDATNVKFILDQCLVYVEDYFVAEDTHIIAMHAHDYWDDYVSEIDVTTVRYESMVDILWIVGLEAIAPVYTTLGDTTRATYCRTIATALRGSLEDYRKSDGSFYYAIKTDGTLYISVEALPGTLYAAWLMNDEKCKNWIMNYGEALRIKGGLSHYPLTHSNALTSTLDYGLWMPYMPIVGLIAHENGDDSVINDLASSFPFGGIVEYATISKSNALIHSSHALSFPWAEAMYLVMINLLKN